MRTTKVIAFSVPPEFEKQIVKHAKAEHRTTSEYVREAIRYYMELRQFDKNQKSIAAKARKRGVKKSDVADVVEDLRSS